MLKAEPESNQTAHNFVAPGSDESGKVRTSLAVHGKGLGRARKRRSLSFSADGLAAFSQTQPRVLATRRLIPRSPWAEAFAKLTP